MPRQGGGRSGGGARSAPSRPSGFSAPPKAAPQQSRSASTAAYPPANRTGNGPPAAAPTAQVPAQQSSGGGSFLGNVASTAMGVAGGHALSNMLFGGSSSTPAEPQQAAVQAQDSNANQQSSWGARNCEVDAQQFTKCMDEQQGNMQICGWYLEQLKACQQAAKQY